MTTVISRAGWGARAPKRKSYIATPVKENWLHHTAGSEAGTSGMRKIQNYHMDTKGWADIAYSWVYDPGNRTWYEGRGWGVQGGHTYGHNSVSHGICIMGNFENESVTNAIIFDIAWLLVRGYRAGKGPKYLTGGHRDVRSTACPGKNLYNVITAINNKVDEILGGATEPVGNNNYYSANYTVTLRRGDKGSAVTALQKELNAKFTTRLTVDGDFGPATEGGVKTSQNKMGVTADGIVGPNTRAALLAYGQEEPDPEPTPPPTPEPDPDDDQQTEYPEFQEHFDWAVEQGIYSKWTRPATTITAESLAVYLKRAYDNGVYGNAEHSHPEYAPRQHGHGHNHDGRYAPMEHDHDHDHGGEVPEHGHDVTLNLEWPTN